MVMWKQYLKAICVVSAAVYFYQDIIQLLEYTLQTQFDFFGDRSHSNWRVACSFIGAGWSRGFWRVVCRGCLVDIETSLKATCRLLALNEVWAEKRRLARAHSRVSFSLTKLFMNSKTRPSHKQVELFWLPFLQQAVGWEADWNGNRWQGEVEEKSKLSWIELSIQLFILPGCVCLSV